MSNRLHNKNSPRFCDRRRSKCQTRYCRGRKAPGRRICYKCKQRRFRSKDPVRSYYYSVAESARKRGYAFELPMPYFRKLVEPYIELFGRGKMKLTLDRIKNELGYVPGNVQILEHTDNIKKYYVHYYNDRKTVTYE
jgi:hypothetical protein